MLSTIVLLILLLAGIGALFRGGESFGDSVRKGCGCILMLLFVLMIVSIFIPL